MISKIEEAKNSMNTSESFAYRISGAALGAVIGVLTDIVQRQELCASVKLSKIFAMHLQLPAPPIVFVVLIFFLGIFFSMFLEKHSAHKTFFIAAGFASLLQNGVPVSLPQTGLTASTSTIGFKDSAYIQYVSGAAKADFLYVKTEGNNPIGDISMRFDLWDWRKRKWTSLFTKSTEESDMLKVKLSNLLYIEGKYYITIEAPGYKIITKQFSFRRDRNYAVIGFLSIQLERTAIPLSIQRLFITPPTERAIPDKMTV